MYPAPTYNPTFVEEPEFQGWNPYTSYVPDSSHEPDVTLQLGRPGEHL